MAGFPAAFGARNRGILGFRTECSAGTAEGYVESALHLKAERSDPERLGPERSAGVGRPDLSWRPGLNIQSVRLNIQFPNVQELNVRPRPEYSAQRTEYSDKTHHTGASPTHRSVLPHTACQTPRLPATVARRLDLPRLSPIGSLTL